MGITAFFEVEYSDPKLEKSQPGASKFTLLQTDLLHASCSSLLIYDELAVRFGPFTDVPLLTSQEGPHQFQPL